MRRSILVHPVLNRSQPQPAQTDVNGEQMLERLRLLAQRTGGIAHDLNNMLGTMIGYGALVIEDLPADDPSRAFMAKVMEAGSEAQHLIAELLDSARAETLRARTGLSKAA
jgi:signal transduction histidine kinase